MKTIAWLAGIGTLLTGAVYMVVSLNRWEWNRALFFGLIVLIAEVGLGHRARPAPADRLERSPSSTRPSLASSATPGRRRRPFAWLKESTSARSNVFITFLVGGGVLLSGVAWLVDRVAAHTSTPSARSNWPAELGTDQLPRAAGCSSTTSPRWPRTCPAPTTPRSASCSRRPAASRVSHRPTRLVLGLVGLVVGGLAVSALREATLSTHQAIAAGSRSRSWSRSDPRAGSGTRPRARWSRPCSSPAASRSTPTWSASRAPRGPTTTRPYRAVLEPAMDETNRRQFRGCLEDWTLDQFLVDVVAFEDTP